jgi:hypothetical protein
MDMLAYLGVATLGVATVVVAAIALGRRVDRLADDLAQLRRVWASPPSIDSGRAAVEPLAPVPDEPSQIAELKLHLWQIKRQQVVLLERVSRISSTLAELGSIPGSLEQIKREQGRAMEALVTISAELEDWIARFDSASSELTHLLESEPVVEFQNSIHAK